MQPTTISPLEAFRKAFLPFAVVRVENNDGIIYPFRDRSWAERAQVKAVGLIMANGFSVIASVEDYRLDGKTRIGLVIRPVPEEYTFADEVQDTEDYQEEKAEWNKE